MSTAKVKYLNKSHEEKEEIHYIPKRCILTLLSFWGMLNVFAMRVNLSVAMVAMVNTTTEKFSNNSYSKVECPNLIPKNQSSEVGKFTGEQYNWSAEEQGLILSAFFYGYVLTQIPGGFFSEKFGAKWLFGGGVLATALLTLLTPISAKWGIVPLIIVRVLEGLGEGVTFPAMNLIISRWSPKLERSRMSTMINSGSQIGNVLSMPISGWLCSTNFLGGWPSAFYVFGIIGVIWFIFWAILVYETPNEHPSISERELNYIQKDKEEVTFEKAKTPWKSIATSLPMWALVLAHVGQNFGFIIILTELPTYLSSILHFDVKSNGMLSALPYIVQAATAWSASFIADRLRRTNTLSITNIRKLCNSIGLYGPAICLLGVTVSGCRPELIVALFTLCMAFNGFIYSGYNVTHVDMSPTFAGTLFGITNAISNLNGVIGPAIVGAFISRGATIANWSDVFYIAAAVYIFTATFFACFASAELQPWGQREKDSSEKISVKNINTIGSKS